MFGVRSVLLSLCLLALGDMVPLECAPCRCEQSGTSLVLVDCAYKDLFEVPESIPLNTTHLDLSHNHISDFYNGHLHKLRELKELKLGDNDLYFLMEEFRAANLTTLHLHNNHITFIEPTVFFKLKKLQELRLNGNQLDMISSEFRSLLSLRNLDISSNFITSIDPYAFRKMTKLRHLDVRQNQLTFLDENHLVSCRELETFNADHNELFGLPDVKIFRRNNKLKEVTLANNSLLVLSSLEFSDSRHLEVINVSNNNINFFWPNSKKLQLREPWKLKYLDLSGNSLPSLPLDTLFELASGEAVIALHDNSLICDPVFLTRFTAYIHSTSNQIVNPQLILCSKPDSLKGQVVGKFSCPVGATFNICSKRAEPRCDEVPDGSDTGARCVSRCECPAHLPISYNGKCSSSEICNSLDIGPCYKERAGRMMAQSVDKGYVPLCDEQGYYRPLQCDQDLCWCTDLEGNARCPLFHATDGDTDTTCEQGEHVTRQLSSREYLLMDSECYNAKYVNSVPNATQQLSHKMCSFSGDGRVRTFQGKQFQVSADCYYGLVNDLSLKPRYHVYARFTTCNKTFCIPSILLYINRVNPIHITSDFSIFFNGHVRRIKENERLSFLKNSLVIVRDRTKIRIASKYLEITYSSHQYLIIRMNTDRLTNMIGSCGATTGVVSLKREHDVFEEWKLINSCEGSKLLTTERRVSDTAGSKCQVLRKISGVSDIELERIIQHCEADTPLIGALRAYCASLAMTQTLRNSYQVKDQLDEMRIDDLFEEECR